MSSQNIQTGSQYISNALECLSKGDMEQAFQLVRAACALKVPIPELHLIRAVCIADMGFNFLAQHALQEELKAFPENNKARVFMQTLEASAREPLKMNHPLSSYPLISFVFVNRGDLARYRATLDSLLHQKYPNIEVIVVDTTAVNGELLSLDPKVRRISALQKNSWEALLLGLGAAHGRYLSVLSEDTVAYHDSSLSGVAEYLCLNGDIDFISCDRSYLNEGGIPSAMRCSKIRWSRSLLLEPINFNPPMLSLKLCQTVWSTRLFKLCDWSYQINGQSAPKEALDFAVLARLMRHSSPVALALPLCVSNISINGGNEELSTRYIAEALAIIDTERRRGDTPDRRGSSSPPEIPVVEFVGPNASPAGNGVENFANPLLPNEAIRLVQEEPQRISLVTPSFNQGEYLEETIDSVLSQGYPNLEYIIIDGGSTDNSVEIIRKYSQFLTYWCSEGDGGQYYAIQKGLELSTGDILSWINSDDKLSPHSLNSVAYVFKMCPHVHWISGLHGVIINGREYVHPQPALYSRKRYLYESYDRPFIQQEGTFWRRGLWDRAGGSIDLRRRLAGDMELWTRFFRFERLYTLCSSLAKYRKHSSQRSQLFLADYHREAYQVLQEELRVVSAGLYPEMFDAPEALKIEDFIEQSTYRQTGSRLI